MTAPYLGDFAEDSTVEIPWDSNDGDGASITRSTDGTIYVEKSGALASSGATAATITKANPGVVTDTAHGLEDGDEVFFYNLTEMTEVNQTIQTVANKTDNTFEIENTSGHGSAESTGGAWVQVNAADVTDTEDYKGVTGCHHISIDTSADDYFAVANDYTVYLLAATIDTQTVNAVLATFSIENRFTEVDVTKWLGTAAATPTVAGVPEVDVTHLVGVSQSATDLKDFADTGYNPATHKVAGVLLTDTVTTYTNNTVQSGDAYAVVNHADHGNAKLVRSTTPANSLDVTASGQASADMTYIHGTALTETDGQLAGRFVNFFDQASVTFHVATALSSFKATGFSTHDAAGVKTAIEANGSKLDHLWEMTEDDSGTRRLTENALEESPSGGASAAEVKTAIEAAGSHLALILADTGTDGVKLADDSIKAATFDESTAYPLKHVDTGSTKVARTGADGDTLEDLSDEIAALTGSGGSVATLTVTDDVSSAPVVGAVCWITTDEAGYNVIPSAWTGDYLITRGLTDSSGEITFYLAAGTYYLWVTHDAYSFENPTEVVQA